MADETIPAAAIEAVSADPVSATIEPVAPAPIESVIEAAPVEAPAETLEAAESTKTEEAEKPVEAAAEEPKPAEHVEPAEPVALAYEAFKLPDGVSAAQEEIDTFTGILGEYKLPQEAGQKLMDLYGAATKKFVEQAAQHQQDVFAQTRKDWREDFFKSAGNRSDTVANDAKFAITEAVKDPKARKEVWSVLDFTGAGDNKHVINAFAALGRRLRERSAPAPSISVNPNASLTKADKRYGPRA